MKIIKDCQYRGKMSGVVVKALETIDPLGNFEVFGAEVISSGDAQGYGVGMIFHDFDINSFELVKETEIIKIQNAMSVIVTDYLNNTSTNIEDLLSYLKTPKFEHVVLEQIKNQN